VALWGEKRPEVAVTPTGDTFFAEKPTLTKFDTGTRIFKSVSEYENKMNAKNYIEMSEMFEKVVIVSFLSDEKCGELLAWLNIYGGGNSACVLNKGLNAAIQLAQKKCNLYGGEIPNVEIVTILQKKSIETYSDINMVERVRTNNSPQYPFDISFNTELHPTSAGRIFVKASDGISTLNVSSSMSVNDGLFHHYVINKLNNELSCIDIQVDFEDIISECVENNASIHISLTGIGSFGEFPIDIYHFGPLYWVSAQEFDSIKYFNSAEDAIACAEFEYDSFLNEDSEEV
jgi:hypothetical protein